jgi:uncharacterized membrane protein
LFHSQAPLTKLGKQAARGMFPKIISSVVTQWPKTVFNVLCHPSGNGLGGAGMVSAGMASSFSGKKNTAVFLELLLSMVFRLLPMNIKNENENELDQGYRLVHNGLKVDFFLIDYLLCQV